MGRRSLIQDILEVFVIEPFKEASLKESRKKRFWAYARIVLGIILFIGFFIACCLMYV